MGAALGKVPGFSNFVLTLISRGGCQNDLLSAQGLGDLWLPEPEDIMPAIAAFGGLLRPHWLEPLRRGAGLSASSL